MNHRDFERIRFVTRKFNSLQGLRTGVPNALPMLVWGLEGLSRRWSLLMPALFVLAMAAGHLLKARARTYYAGRFGVVVPTMPRPAAAYRLSIFSPGGAAPRIQQDDPNAGARLFVLMYGVMLAFFWWAGRFHPAMATLASLVYLGGGVGLISRWWVEREHHLSQGYYALSGLLCLALGAFAIGSQPAAWNQVAGALAVLGAAIIVCGLLDHLELMRVLGPPPPRDSAEAR
jgi:hypothetical protein